jgi:hypothetical protein
MGNAIAIAKLAEAIEEIQAHLARSEGGAQGMMFDMSLLRDAVKMATDCE